MVARINTGKSITKSLNYNEQKVQQGMAEILHASGFIKDVERLNFYDKMTQFERHTSLNERAITNAIHVSLNFPPTEILTNETMTAIAEEYMQKIGFGNQPYLVYRHYDAGHPHIHIVSTNIEGDGKRISMHNLGRNQSEAARKAIEENFSLIKAAESTPQEGLKQGIVNAQKVRYGKTATKQAISNVLHQVINHYKYASLPELNAVLKLYNVTAERGSEASRMFKKKGLVYRVLDDSGNKMGTPIKASAFAMKPTMANLEKKFIENEGLKAAHSKRLQASIGWTLNTPPVDINAFIIALEKERISCVLRKGKDDVIYGITYVDHKTKCVFNGSDLGKRYSAKAVLEKCTPKVSEQQKFSVKEKLTKIPEAASQRQVSQECLPGTQEQNKMKHPFIEIVPNTGYVPYGFKKKKKKKKRMTI